MRLFLVLIFFSIIIHGTYTQNLIPNPSFETYTTQINQNLCSSGEDFERRTRYWFSPTDVSPDVCKVHENNNTYPDNFRLPQPVSGRCLAGIITNYHYTVCKTYKEYISIQLKEALLVGETYTFEFWITSEKTDHFSIGAYFGMDKIDLNQCSMLELPAQLQFEDTISDNQWKKVSFEFEPQKPYSFVTIGNFKRSKKEKHQYLYLDDFQLTENTIIKEYEKEKVPLIVVEEIFNPKNILFENGKYDLLPSSFFELDKLVDYLQHKVEGKLHIEGHTDNSGTTAFNQELSINRAEAIKKYLITKGIDAERIYTLGYGQSRPIATNDTEAGRTQNRRVTFEIL